MIAGQPTNACEDGSERQNHCGPEQGGADRNAGEPESGEQEKEEEESKKGNVVWGRGDYTEKDEERTDLRARIAAVQRTDPAAPTIERCVMHGYRLRPMKTQRP